jgi:DNA-binding NarL/FixJ family response regulator
MLEVCAAVEGAGAVRVGIVDDHAIVREGLAHVIDGAPSLELVLSVGSQAELLAALPTTPVDVCLVDLSLPDANGIELISVLRDQYPDLEPLVFTAHHETVYGIPCLDAGAAGFVQKGTGGADIRAAIEQVAAGHVYLSPALATLLVSRSARPVAPHTHLSHREMSVLVRLASGLTNAQISAELSLDPRTVSTYRRRVLNKLGLSTNFELVRYATDHGIVVQAPRVDALSTHPGA